MTLAQLNLFVFTPLCVSGEVPLAESECEAKWSGRHGPALQDHRGRNRG